MERLDENTLKLSWTIDHSSETLSRYRILFAREGAGDRLFEWPGIKCFLISQTNQSQI